MRRATAIWLSVTLLCGGSGCAICSSELDDDYGAYGGAWERHDPRAGRVGSAFQPAGDRVVEASHEALDVAAPEAAPPDELMEGPSDTPDSPDGLAPSDSAPQPADDPEAGR